MITTIICIVFVLGYLAIAFEHNLHINKAASALFTGVLCWTLYATNGTSFIQETDVPKWFVEEHAATNAVVEGESGAEHAAEGGASHLVRDYIIEGQLAHNLTEVAQVLFFLLGAMTIVEIVDAFGGFSVITDRIQATNKLKLLWLIGFLTFFMSSVLDNLTTTIVMISLVRKLVDDHKTRLFFAGMIVCAANAGGAWTVIGDVTTTMLWIKDKISVVEVMIRLFIPSMICFLAPLLLISMFMKGDVQRPQESATEKLLNVPSRAKTVIFAFGILGLLLVPIFKLVTHLPPFMGILGSLSIVWIVAELLRRDFDHVTKTSTHILDILKRVDSSTILFFLGILLAVGSLSQAGILTQAAGLLDTYVGNIDLIAIMIGLLSSVVDNVPLVAAGIEMYQFPRDHEFWMFLAYTAGTGGSCLIIGSAAGVAAMGLEKINFIWYMVHISPFALIGYFAGAAAYYGIVNYLHW